MADKPTDHLAEAKKIVDKDVDDLGDFDIARAVAHATIAVADALGALVDNPIAVRKT